MTGSRVTEYKDREMMDSLLEIAEQMKMGKITGFVWSCKLQSGSHRLGFAGEYRQHPEQMLVVAGRINHRVNQLVDDGGHALTEPAKLQ